MATVISIHDVSPATATESAALLEMVEDVGIHASLLVIPGPWRGVRLEESPWHAAWLRAAESRGHEIVVHGWQHREIEDPSSPVGSRLSARVRARGCAEFATIGRNEARRRALLGREVLRAAGLSPTGFVAPGWLVSAAAVDALADLRFAYTATRSGILDLATGDRVPVPAWCQRPDSLLGRAAARVVEEAVRRRVDAGRPVRLALHPADVNDPHLLRSTERLLDTVARAPGSTVTYGRAVADRRRRTSARLLTVSPIPGPRPDRPVTRFVERSSAREVS